MNIVKREEIIDVLESFQFRYNPNLANQIITNHLQDAGAQKINNVWHYENRPIEITFFIRSDDPARKAIGEILSSKLESIGFVVKKEFGDLNKAFVLVYGSDPADQKWHLYTEGWGSSGFSRYDSVALAQMYSPWFSNMPALEMLYFVSFYHLNISKSPQHKKGKQQGMVRQIKLDENMKIDIICKYLIISCLMSKYLLLL